MKSISCPFDALKSASHRFTSAVLRAVGISRIGDVTDLDPLRFPMHVGYRHNAIIPERNVSIAVGKGLTRAQSRLGAIMEAVERFSAERPRYRGESRIAKIRELKGAFVRPGELILPHDRPHDAAVPLEWVRGVEIFSRRKVWVPASAVFCPYDPPEGAGKLHVSGSNGLASAFSETAAFLSALLEVFERDAYSVREAAQEALPVDMTGCAHPILRRITRRIAALGFRLVIKDITLHDGIPTFFAALDDPLTRDPMLLSRGRAAHWDPHTAMLKAVLEAVQARYTYIVATREDLGVKNHFKKFGYERMLKTLAYWFEADGPSRSVNDYRTRGFATLAAAKRHVLRCARRAGFARIICVNLTVKEVGIPVVRTIVPGAEHWHDRRRIGSRLRRALMASERKTPAYGEKN